MRRYFSLLIMALAGTTACFAGELVVRAWSDVAGRWSVNVQAQVVGGDTAVSDRRDGAKAGIDAPKGRGVIDGATVRTNGETPYRVSEQGEFDTTAEQTLATEVSSSLVAERKVHSEVRKPSDRAARDWKTAEPIALDPAVGWNLTVPEVQLLATRPLWLSLPPKTDFFENAAGFVISPGGKQAVILYRTVAPGTTKKSHKLVLCDLENKTVVGTWSLGEENIVPLAIFSGGDTGGCSVLCRRDDFGFGNHDLLSVRRLSFATTGSQPALQASASVPSLRTEFAWVPYESATGAGRDVAWADVSDDGTLVTCSGAGVLVIWDPRTFQPKARLQTTSGHRPALSPDRKWLAFAIGHDVGILDLQQRRVIALQNSPRVQNFPILAFSPSGKKLACLSNHREICVWDVVTGALEADMTLPAGVTFQGDFCFPHDEFILGGNRYLLHWKSQLFVWEYTNLEKVVTLGDLACALVKETRPDVGTPRWLVVEAIPHAAALQLLKKAEELPDTFAFRPGVSVKLDASAIPEEARENVTRILTERLEQMDCRLQEDAAITVVAGVERAKERTVTYIHSGDYKVQEYRVWLRIQHGDQVLWSASAGGVPPILILKRGENVGQKLQELTGKPNYDWFKVVALPKYLQDRSRTNSLALGSGPLLVSN